MFNKIKNFFSRIWEKVKKPLVWTGYIVSIPVLFISAIGWGLAAGAGAWTAFWTWLAIWVGTLIVGMLCATLIDEWAQDEAFAKVMEEMRQSEARRNERVREYEDLRSTLHNLNRGL